MGNILEEAEEIVRPLIRSIDKRAEYTTKLTDGERPAVSVAVSLRKRSTTVTIPVEELKAAAQSSMRRNQVRTTLKRAMDRMMFEKLHVASTKMERPATTGEGFFRPPTGGRGRR